MKTISKAYLLALFFLFACHAPKEPQNPLMNSDTMAVFLTELHFYESMVNNRYIESEQSPLFYRQLFEKHNVTPQQFDSALTWFEFHHKEYMVLYYKIRQNIENELNKINSGIYAYYLPKLPSIWTYYGKAPATDTTWNTLQEFEYYLQLPATELRTNHSSSHPYVERLRSTTPYWKVGNQ